MKKDFTPENIEDFLKRSADSLRMKPGDAVWQNLSRDLGRRRRRHLLGLGIFLLVTSAAGYSVITNLSDKAVSAQPVNELRTNNASPEAAKTSTQKTQIAVPASETATAKEPPALPTTSAPLRSLPSASATPLTKVAATERLLSSAPFETANGLSVAVRKEPVIEEGFTPTVVDSYTEFDKPVAKNEAKPLTYDDAPLPLSIESVVNAYKMRNKSKRFETQLYFTPTISYRKLAENKSYLQSLGPNAFPSSYPAFYTNVNSRVTHKPDVGFETGLAAKYRLSKNLKVRAGVQFNVNRYDVKAFNSGFTQTTIALNNGSGSIDSLNTYSRYSNVGGYKSNWLQNLSFQFAIPIGLEYNFGGTDDVKFGVGATIQPTYILGDRAFLITTDYKNYTQVPWLIRRWNVNTAVETFVSYKGWQIGPQVRYQLLSSFISQYPVKENLFDFGLKVGMTLGKK